MISSHPSVAPSPAYPDSGIATPATERSPTPPRRPSRFVACVRSPEAVERIRFAVAALSAAENLVILQNENVKGVEQADVVILACKPYMVADNLSEPGMCKALAGKLLISILAGVTGQQIEDILAAEPQTTPTRVPYASSPRAAISARRLDLLLSGPHCAPAALQHGRFDCALWLRASLRRSDARFMAAQTTRGTADMVLGGENPAPIREKVSTPGGCTIGGLLVLEEASLRGTIARGVREAAVVASELGKGGVGVNGTRFVGR